jgi:hypothetical protein
MNLRMLPLVALLLLGTFSTVLAGDISVEEYAKRYYNQDINAPDTIDGRPGLMMSDFPQVVPVSLQTDVLERMFEMACSDNSKEAYWVIIDVLNYMQSLGNPKISRRLDEHLSALAKDSNWSMRTHVLEFLGGLKREKDQDLIVAALNDPKDDVRGAAIDALRGRPDAGAIFKKYIKDHQSDPAYRTSVLYARAGLSAIHDKASGR